MAQSNSNSGKIPTDYRVPSRYSNVDDRLRWVKTKTAEGLAFIQSQRGYQDIEHAINIIAKNRESSQPEKFSKTYVNWIKRQVREMVATLSGIRPAAGFKVDNSEYYGQADILNKLHVSWWLNTFADRVFRKVLQYAAVCGTGYLYVSWDPNLIAKGRGDIALKALGPGDIYPIQLPPDGDLQKTYAVIIREELPIAIVHKRWPQFQDIITPTHSAPTGIRAAMGKANEILQGAMAILGMDGQGSKVSSQEYSSPTVDLYSIYIDDPAINTTGQDVVMGDPGLNYTYTVPYLGKQIPTSQFIAGQEIMHTATPQEALLYPNRRLIVCTETALLYDNASCWWHGMVPVIKFTMDDWPWDYLGYSAVRDTDSLQSSMNAEIRGVTDAVACRLDPPIMFDEDMVSDTNFEEFSGREYGTKWKVNKKVGTGRAVEPILPYQHYDILNQGIPEWIQAKQEWISNLIGSKDITAMAKAQQIPSADTMEKYLEMAGALVQDISRNLEMMMRDLGQMWGPLCFQFYPLKRRIMMLGKDGITEEDFTFKYAEMIPEEPSDLDPRERARRHCFNFFFHVVPNSLTKITQTTQKLLYLQLWRDGRFPIDPWTLAEALDINGFGPLPDGVKGDIISKWEAWMKLQAKVGIDVSNMQAQNMLMNKLQEMMQQAGAQGGQGGQGGPPTNSGNGGPTGRPEGRPPTAQTVPHFEQKNGADSGPRQVVAES